MNRWWADARLDQAEVDELAAERAERRGDVELARQRHLAAATAYATVALSVPDEFPNTRHQLMLAATVAAAGAGVLTMETRRRYSVKPGWKTTEFYVVAAVNLWAMFGAMLPPSSQAIVVSVATACYGFARAMAKFGDRLDVPVDDRKRGT